MDVYVEFSQRDLYVIVLLSFLLLLAAQPLLAIRSIGFGRDYIYVVFSDGSFSILHSSLLHLTIVLVAVGTVTLHEIFHMLTLKIIGIDFKLKPITLFRLPVAVQIDYDEMEMWQYLITALSPQILTIALIIIVHFTKYDFKTLVVLAAILNFASSSGDFYGIVKTLIKVRNVRGRIVKVEKLRYLIKL